VEYKILEKETFTIVGYSRRFKGEDSYVEVPKFWDEHYASGNGKIIDGMFGACIDSDGKEFDYIIADLYLPWKEIPDGCVTQTFDTGTWAVFPWHGPCPNSLQTVNTEIFREWLPNCKEYEISAGYNLEIYFSPTDGEIWIPIKKKDEYDK
jgi:AraC family transcriptional regulator